MFHTKNELNFIKICRQVIANDRDKIFTNIFMPRNIGTKVLIKWSIISMEGSLTRSMV